MSLEDNADKCIRVTLSEALHSFGTFDDLTYC